MNCKELLKTKLYNKLNCHIQSFTPSSSKVTSHWRREYYKSIDNKIINQNITFLSREISMNSN